MCGRYRLTAKERYLWDHFGLDDDPPWTPRWNIAPTQLIATIRQHRTEPRRIFGLLRWGLVPYWAKEPSIGLKTINAMAETAAEKPAFRDAMRLRRCLILADRFYEWKRLVSKEKQTTAAPRIFKGDATSGLLQSCLNSVLEQFPLQLGRVFHGISIVGIDRDPLRPLGLRIDPDRDLPF